MIGFKFSQANHPYIQSSSRNSVIHIGLINKMSVYIIGDIQGCYDSLQKLLEAISFDSQTDRLGFVGDLINRGPESLKTLRFIRNLKHPIVVLGNHDLHLLAVGYGLAKQKDTDTFSDILNATDSEELLAWLRHQPLIYQDIDLNYCMVHAGIPPQWSVAQAALHADEIHQALRHSHLDFLAQMHGDQPDEWSDHLQGWDRLRYITNALTRMRFCDKNGKLDLQNKTNQSSQADFKAWFEWKSRNTDVVFGHWASLEGKCDKVGYYALDTGCVWNRTLTALRIEDKKIFNV